MTAENEVKNEDVKLLDIKYWLKSTIFLQAQKGSIAMPLLERKLKKKEDRFWSNLEEISWNHWQRLIIWWKSIILFQMISFTQNNSNHYFNLSGSFLNGKPLDLIRQRTHEQGQQFQEYWFTTHKIIIRYSYVPKILHKFKINHSFLLMFPSN